MRIAYLSETDPGTTWAHSGGNTRIHAALCAHAGEVTVLSSHWHRMEPVRRALERLPEALCLRARWRAHLLLAREISRGVAAELDRGRYDVLFCAYSFTCLAGLRLPYPMVTAFTSDATMTVYRKSEVGAAFGSYLSVSRIFDPLVFRAERRVFRKADLLLWPSDWLKREADQLYGLAPERSRVVPWGANVAAPPRETLALGTPLAEPVRLLLVGRDWQAKGGPLAVATLAALRARGLRAGLTVVGCTPPEADRIEGVTVHPYLDKTKPEELALFTRLFATSHFMMMPSFESYGFAFCEAAAYGLPALCLRVGGVPVEEGVSGHALPAGSGPEDFADRIVAYLSDPEGYRALRAASRARFEDALNWEAWGRRVAGLLEERVAARAARAGGRAAPA